MWSRAAFLSPSRELTRSGTFWIVFFPQIIFTSKMLSSVVAFCALLGVAVGCGVPPRHWCDNIVTAQQCNVSYCYCYTLCLWIKFSAFYQNTSIDRAICEMSLASSKFGHTSSPMVGLQCTVIPDRAITRVTPGDNDGNIGHWHGWVKWIHFWTQGVYLCAINITIPVTLSQYLLSGWMSQCQMFRNREIGDYEVEDVFPWNNTKSWKSKKLHINNL